MMSWIHRRDLVRICLACLEDFRYEGVINAVAPRPASNRDFSRALGRALGRPALIPAPPPALRLALGEKLEPTREYREGLCFVRTPFDILVDDEVCDR
jgi:hypothetical protein